KNSQSLVPKPQKQQRAECPFGNAQKPTGSADAKHRIQPENQRTIANKWDQDLRLIGEPLLVTKSQKDKHHRCPDEMVVEVSGEQPRPRQDVSERVHSFTPSYARSLT